VTILVDRSRGTVEAVTDEVIVSEEDRGDPRPVRYGGRERRPGIHPSDDA